MDGVKFYPHIPTKIMPRDWHYEWAHTQINSDAMANAQYDT